MNNTDYIFPPGSSVVMKQATIIDKKASVIYNYEVTTLGSIWNKIMTTFEGKELPTEKIWQFFIKSNEIVIGSKVMYGRGNGRKEAIVRGMDGIKEGRRWITIEFESKDQKTVLYNACSLVGFESLIPIDFDLYYKVWDNYKYRNKGDLMRKGKLQYLIAPYYQIKHINDRAFASNPIFPNTDNPEIRIEPEIKEKQEKPIEPENKKITLTVSLSGLEKQLEKQGYKLEKL